MHGGRIQTTQDAVPEDVPCEYDKEHSGSLTRVEVTGQVNDHLLLLVTWSWCRVLRVQLPLLSEIERAASYGCRTKTYIGIKPFVPRKISSFRGSSTTALPGLSKPHAELYRPLFISDECTKPESKCTSL